MPILDIIIPVYRGLAETQRCLESVLRAKKAQATEIIVVDDATPEPAIAEWLDGCAERGEITLIRQESNRGFVASVNRAMRLHPDRDVILLNSDTEVPDDWVDHLVQCADAGVGAGAGEKVASVTPLSNNATLASYPRFVQPNGIPTRETFQQWATFCAAVNANTSVAIPTGVGFCMWVSRQALNDVGFFDEEAFGRGYGEENDWCMRATASGYSHLLCGSTFVFHRGEVSFAADSQTGKDRAQSVIDARYPDYRRLIGDHIEDDPARSMRRRLDIARLTASPLPKLLMITHNWGGGTEQHVMDLIELVQGHAEVLVMRPVSPYVVSLSWVTGRDNREEFCAYFNTTDDWDRLLQFLRDIGIARVHLHHIHGFPASILDVASQIEAPLDVTLHDYFPLTPQYHLAPGGEMPSHDSARAWGLPQGEYRDKMQALLSSAARVIQPSKDLKDRISSYFADMRSEVWPHPDVATNNEQVPLKVLLLGGLTRDKGLDVVHGCAMDARNRRLPLHFKILGHTETAIPIYPDLPITLAGSYTANDLEWLIALEHADVFLFPAQIPESFSYTLSAAMRTGLPIVASRLGAFVERLQGYGKANLMDWNAPAPEWNDRLLSFVGMAQPPRVLDSNYAAVYRQRYLAPLNATATANVASPLAARHCYHPHELPRDREHSFVELYTAGVECGYGPFRKLLKERAQRFDRQIQEARNAADAAHEAAKEAGRHAEESAVRFQAVYSEQVRATEAARAEYRNVIESTTWRMTFPIRWAAQTGKNIVARISRGLRVLRLLPVYASTATQILRQQGALALWRRIRGKLARPSLPMVVQTRLFTIESNLLPLALSNCEVPRWTIIIPVFGQHKLTYTCIKSIAMTCTGKAIEVVVVDDCSPEPAEVALSMVSGIKIIRNQQNLGFLHSCNEAVKSARGEFVVLLNNDTIVTDDWLSAMTTVFEEEIEVGLVGVKLLFPDGKLQEAGGIVWHGGSASNYGRGQDPRRPEFNYRREVDYCSGACIMLPVALWHQLDGFDTRYAPAYYEDTDLAFRVREAGYRVIYQPHAEVVHFEGQTSGTDVTKGVKKHQVINQATFASRWQHVLTKHRAHGLAQHVERDRHATRRVLVIDNCLVMPDQDSGSVRMYEALRLMHRLGCRISFVADNGQYIEKYARLMQSIGVEILHAPFVDPLSDAITKGGADFDVVILSRAAVAMKYIDAVERYMPKAKLIFDTVDLHFVRQQREAEITNSSIGFTSAAKMKEIELDLIARADLTFVVSANERDLLEKLAPRAQVHVLSNIHEPAPGSNGFAQRSGVVFIGGFRHPPNVDAMIWYAREVLPLLRKRGANICTTVIGSGDLSGIQPFAADDFILAGHVPDVEPLFNATRISIAPLRYGAGVKGKVNLAMQFGVPVVATTCAVEGMSLDAGRAVLVADDPVSFADALHRLYHDERQWLQLREGGLDNVRRCFSRERARLVLQRALDL